MTAAELLSHYADVKARIYGQPKIVNVGAPKPVIVKPKIYDDPPSSTWKPIVRRIAKYHGVTYEAIVISNSKMHKVAHARQAAMYWVHRVTGWSMTQVGRRFDRDHTTVLHAIRAHTKRRAERNQKRMEKLNGRVE